MYCFPEKFIFIARPVVCATLLLVAVFAQEGNASDKVWREPGLRVASGDHSNEVTSNQYEAFKAWREPGLRVAFGDHSNKVNFNQYEAFMTLDLPWQSELAPNLKVGAFVEGSAGALVGGGESGVVLAFGGGFYLLTFDDHFRVSVGCNPTYISRHRYGSQDLGGPLQFTSYIGVYWIITENFEIGYRFQHMSNAHLYDSNPGVNQHVISAGYRF